MEPENRRTILFALTANLVIALAKLAGGLTTGSKALLAEAAHSVADCINQGFLLISLAQGKRRPDETHPFGRGMERFFWAFMAAVLIFVGGAVFSIGQGVLVLLHGEGPPTDLRAAFFVLVVALAAESIAFARALRQVRRQARADGKTVSSYLHDSRDPTLKVVLGEDGAAVAGVVVALVGVTLFQLTGEAVWDGAASIVIGLLLALVAYVIGSDAKRLLIGQAASRSDRREIELAFLRHPDVETVSELLTMQLGPEDILVAARVELADDLSTTSIERVMDELQRDARRAVAAVRQVFIDPTPAHASLPPTGV